MQFKNKGVWELAAQNCDSCFLREKNLGQSEDWFRWLSLTGLNMDRSISNIQAYPAIGAFGAEPVDHVSPH